MHQPPPIYSQEALELLNAYHWPGNVRELKNIVKRLIILKPGEEVIPSDIKNMIAFEKQPNIEHKIAVPTLAESERKAIEQALVKCNGVLGGKKGAARLLDVPRSTLQYRIKKHGIKTKKLVLLEN